MTVAGTLNKRRWLGLSLNGVLFYFVTPVLIGVTFAGLSNNAIATGDRLAGWPMLSNLTYSVLMVTFGWALKDLACLISAKVLRHYDPPLFAILLIGGLLSHAVIFPFNLGLHATYESLFIAEELRFFSARLDNWLNLDGAYTAGLIVTAMLPAVFLWTIASWFFFHILGMPRYGYPPSRLYLAIYNETETGAETADAALMGIQQPGRPAFMALLPENKRNERIIALKAEQHYVRIYTPQGETLIHERFRSVIAEFQRFGGVQVHRSFAINPEFIQEMCVEDGIYRIVMANDIEIPVSRSHLAVAKRLNDSLSKPADSTT